MSVVLTVSLLITICGFIIIYYADFHKQSKTLQVMEELKNSSGLYTNYIFIMDLSTEKPTIRLGFIQTVDDEGRVNVRLSDNTEHVAIWVGSKNNFFLEEDLDKLDKSNS